jgi:hypothetical protein
MEGTPFTPTSTIAYKSLEIDAEAKKSKSNPPVSCAMRSQNDECWMT